MNSLVPWLSAMIRGATTGNHHLAELKTLAPKKDKTLTITTVEPTDSYGFHAIFLGAQEGIDLFEGRGLWSRARLHGFFVALIITCHSRNIPKPQLCNI